MWTSFLVWDHLKQCPACSILLFEDVKQDLGEKHGWDRLILKLEPPELSPALSIQACGDQQPPGMYELLNYPAGVPWKVSLPALTQQSHLLALSDDTQIL